VAFDIDITARKAAIVLLALDKDEAAEVMKSLSADCLDRITQAIWTLDDVQEEEKTEALTDLTIRLKANPVVGGENKALLLLKEVVGEEQATKIIAKAKKEESNRKAFRSLLNIKSTDLANFLSKEQPSTIAIILGFLPSVKVAEILEFLEEDLRTEIILRLASPTPAKQDIVERIEQVFIRNVVSKITNKKDKDEKDIGGPKVVAEILQSIEKELGDQMLGAIQDHSPDLAAEISSQLFTFEDILGMSGSDMQRLMRDVPMDKLPIALRGVEEELYEKFAGNLSKRAKENLGEEMELMGKVKVSEVQAIQKEIVVLIRSLEAAGELTIATGGDTDEYV
jgi:flagellar motor switch protein FliG